MEKLEYLEEERKKIWEKVTVLSEKVDIIKAELNKTTADHEKDAKGASKKISEYKNRSKEACEAIETNKSQVVELLQKAEPIVAAYENATKLNTLYDNVLSVQKNITEAETALKAKLVELQTNTTSIAALQKQATEASTTSVSLGTKINELHIKAAEKKQEIEDIFDSIAGYDYTDKQTNETLHEEGLREKLERSYTELQKDALNLKNDIQKLKEDTDAWIQNFKINKEGEFDAIKAKIYSLLPSAMTAGLCSAYQEKRIKEEEEIEKALTRFNWGIIFLLLISLIPFALSIYWMVSDKKTLEDVITYIPRVVLAIIPLYIPLLWMAIVANKKINLSKRLIRGVCS